MIIENLTVGDIVEMKKPHPCGSKNKLFEVGRVGSDVKIKCLACGNVIMMDRAAFNERTRKLHRRKEIVSSN